MFEQFVLFFKESFAELKKVTWLSRKEVIGSTVVIIILVIILSIFVSLFDFIFLRFVGWLI